MDVAVLLLLKYVALGYIEAYVAANQCRVYLIVVVHRLVACMVSSERCHDNLAIAIHQAKTTMYQTVYQELEKFKIAVLFSCHREKELFH